MPIAQEWTNQITKQYHAGDEHLAPLYADKPTRTPRAEPDLPTSETDRSTKGWGKDTQSGSVHYDVPFKGVVRYRVLTEISLSRLRAPPRCVEVDPCTEDRPQPAGRER